MDEKQESINSDVETQCVASPQRKKTKKVRSYTIFAEFLGFLISQKKWWLLPIVLILLILGVLIVVAAMNPATAPFIYTLF
jgi:predicted metal-binding membrane protein